MGCKPPESRSDRERRGSEERAAGAGTVLATIENQRSETAGGDELNNPQRVNLVAGGTY
jgi:hypothetical protein